MVTEQQHLELGTRLLSAMGRVEQLEGRVTYLSRELYGDHDPGAAMSRIEIHAELESEVGHPISAARL